MTENMATFYIDKDVHGEFRYTLKDNNNEVILRDSEGHSTKQACEKSIASVRVNAPIDERYDRINNPPNYSFTLKAANHERIGVSEPYTRAHDRDKAIENVKREAPAAPVKDRT